MAEVNKKQMLDELHRNLKILYEREGRYEGNAPRELLNQIQDYQQAIRQTERVVAGRISEEDWQEAMKPLRLDIEAPALDLRGVSLEEAAPFTKAGPDIRQQSNIGPAPNMPPLEMPPLEQTASFAQQTTPEPTPEPTIAPTPVPDIVEQLSASVQEAMRIAAGQAHSLGWHEITSHLLLIGLYHDDDGPVRAVLTAFGWPPANFYRWVNTQQGWQISAAGLDSAADQLEPGDLQSLSRSANVTRIFAQAERIAGERNPVRVRSRHLLQALLDIGLAETDPSLLPVAFTWLQELGVPLQTVSGILAQVSEATPIVPAMFAISASSAFTDTAATQDKLGFELHAQALAEIIVKPETVPPVVIGVYGPWGSGKSTFMALVKKHLDAWDARQHPPPPLGERLRARWFGRKAVAHPRVISVEYNAWAYTDSEKLWAGLVEKISPYLDEQIPVIKKPLFWLRRNTRRFVGALLLGLSPFAVGLAAWLLLNWLGTDLTRLWGEAGQVITGLITLLLSAVGSLRTFATQKPLTDAVSTLLKDYDASEVEGVMGNIQDEFRRTVKDYFLLSGEAAGVEKPAEGVPLNLGKLRQNKLKVVVMIDELDRCPLEKIVDILEGIKIFLAEEIFIVLMAVDTRVIAEAVRLHYRDVNNPNLAREYLEKIIQIPIQVPSADPRQLALFVNSLMQVPADQTEVEADGDTPPDATPPPETGTDDEPSAIQAIAARAPLVVSENLFNPLQLADTVAEQKTITAFAIDYLDSNPRRIKRLLNTYRFVKILATRRGERTDQAEWQQKMINWLGLTMRWPSFMADVVRHDPPPQNADDYLALAEQWSVTSPAGRQPPPAVFALPLPTGADLARFELLADNFIVESPSEATNPGS